MKTPTILITRPMKLADPTSYTYQWGEQAVKLKKSYGYEVVDIKKGDVTYKNVSNAIQYYNPSLYVHFGHGCPSSLQGQDECIITRRFDIDELVLMPNFKEIILPLIYESGCTGTCMNSIDKDICNPLCVNDTNVNLLRGTIVFTVACYSASQLGKCAIKYGTKTYIGYNDLLLFPVDDMNSQDMFRDVHIVFIKELLEGKTVAEAEKKMNAYEDALIRLHKKTKYIALSLLWNKMNRKILGDKNVTIYQQGNV